MQEIRLIQDHGAADLWLANSRGDLPLHEAVTAGSRDVIVWLLKQRPEAVNAANQDGRTLLHLAALNNQIEICKVVAWIFAKFSYNILRNIEKI
jgi:ankyrin repeat protein